MAKPTRVLVAIALSITLFAVPVTTHADGHEPGDLPPAPPRVKPAYPRLDSQLNRLAAQAGQGGEDVFTTSALMYSGSSVAVTVRLSGDADAIAAFITEGGGIAANIGEDYVEAYVPPPLLAELSELENVLWVGTIVPPQPTVLSQGASVHGVPPWNTRGFTGAGVKVGIIDGGFQGFGALMGIELPSTVVARCYVSIGTFTSNLADCENGEVHGTAVAETVVDMAPDVALYISNPISAADSLATTSWMASQGVKVVNRSLGRSYEGPGDGTSPFSNSVFAMIDAAVSGGALFTNSSGNSASKTWYGAYSDTDGDSFHNFVGTDETNNIDLIAGQAVFFELRWDDSWDAAGRDLDLLLVDSSLALVSISFNVQDGNAGRTPYERIIYTVPTTGAYGVVVSHFSGTLPSWIQIRTFAAADFEYSTSARSITPAAESFNPGLLAVGAAPWFDTATIEPFSSQGPTVDGRTKPEIVGADRGDSVSFPGGFAGTSQASPHVAGLAALVLQRFPSMTPAQVATYLKDNALPRGASPNNTWGFGLAQLPAIEPGAPAGVFAAAGDEEATVNWSAPADGGSSITGYTVTSSPGGLTAEVDGSTLDATVTGLTNGTLYAFTVTAANAVGTSTPSAPSNSVTPKGPPDAPADVTAAAGDGDVLVSWTAPASDEGSAITQYSVTSTPGNLVAVVDGSTLSATVTGLTNGTAYTFTVTASNAIGTSDPSAPSNSVIPKGAPLSPTGITATAGNAEVIVGWVAPASDGGSPIFLYVATSDPGGLTGGAGGSATSTVVTGLTNGDAYTFTVKAINALGASPPSSSSPSVVPKGPPDAPTLVTATAGDASATVSWSAPFDGGSAITQYDVTSNPGNLIATVASSALSVTISGLDNGTAYTFTVTATNALGSSVASTPSNAVTPPNTPPTVQAREDISADEGDLLDLQIATFSDSDTSDTHTATVDWGDGFSEAVVVSEAGGSGTVSASHLYPDNGAFTVTVTVIDSAGGATADVFTLDIGNVSPVVSAGPDLSVGGLSGNAFRRASFTDPGAQDTHAASIDWGDGATTTAFVSSARRVVSGSHTYASIGEFTVTITVTDNDGGSGSDSLAITVTSVPAAVSIPSVGVWGMIVLALLLGGQMAHRLGRARMRPFG